jgi:lipopolysaccharide transport system permease protein
MTTSAYLYWQWLRRELAGRYRGSFLGLSWPVVQPLVQIAVFTLVFFQFMNMRWPSANGPGNALDYGLNMFAGLAVFNFYAEVLGRAPSAVLSQPNLVTKVRFPLALLPAVTVGAALVHVVVGAALLAAGMAVFRHLSPAVLLLPVYCLPMLAYGLALSWLLGSLGVYLRDIGQVMPSLISLLMFLTPIFYPVTAVPEGLRFLFQLNPIAWSVEVFRQILIAGELPDSAEFAAHLVISVVLLWVTRRLFAHLAKGFSDVL